MEKTIEQLLELTSGSTPRQSAAPPPPPVYPTSVEQFPPPTAKQWRHPLPKDFLQVPPIIYEIIQQQMMENEYVAEAIGSVTPRPRTRTDSKTGSILIINLFMIYILCIYSPCNKYKCNKHSIEWNARRRIFLKIIKTWW